MDQSPANNRTVLIIAGPTAVGKTGISVSIARQLNTEIISADSRQCFRELNIGVARPSPEQLAAVPHHFIASHSIHDEVTAATFEEYALDKCENLFSKHDVVVMTGGTGLYLKAFYQGLDRIPSVDMAIRNEVRNEYEHKGLEWLKEQVSKEDPLYYATGEINNPQRMMRALEVSRSTGKSILSYQKNNTPARPFRIIRVALRLPKEKLESNIRLRVEQMIEDGLVEEVRSLTPYKHLNALQTVGYKEIFEHLEGKLSLDEAKEQIIINTRQYAKRQITWFNKENFTWLDVLPGIEEKILQMI